MKRVLREGCAYPVWAGQLPENIQGKGWGVIALEPIPAGRCIFEYSGVFSLDPCFCRHRSGLASMNEYKNNDI